MEGPLPEINESSMSVLQEFDSTLTKAATWYRASPSSWLWATHLRHISYNSKKLWNEVNSFDFCCCGSGGGAGAGGVFFSLGIATMSYSTEGVNRLRIECVIKEVGLIPLFP